VLLKEIVAAAVALLSAAVASGVESTPPQGTRYSISDSTQAAAPPPFTLLEPSALLPPIGSLDTELPLDGSQRADQILLNDAGAPESAPPATTSGEKPVAYSLSRDLTAQLSYHHDERFQLGSSDMLRNDTQDQSTAFSTRPDRDVIDLNMSWRLAGSTVGLGYELQSARTGSAPGDVGMSRFLPGNPQSTQSITLGLTRQWGAGHPAPQVVAPPLLPPPELAEAAAQGTPTPSP
jgi:hypothetical protein